MNQQLIPVCNPESPCTSGHPGIHDSDFCKCDTCLWAAAGETRREYDEWELYKAMNDYLKSAGREALAQRIDEFMTANAIY